MKKPISDEALQERRESLRETLRNNTKRTEPDWRGCRTSCQCSLCKKRKERWTR